MNILKNIFLNGKYTLCFSQLIIIPIVIASMFTNITDVSTALEGEKTWFSSLVLVHVFKKKTINVGWMFCTWKALARARAPSFSRRFLPAINTLSLSGAPFADDCLWHSIRASARIYTNHTAQLWPVMHTWIRMCGAVLFYCKTGQLPFLFWSVWG